MTWRERKKQRAERRANLMRHGALNASAGLPEAHDTRFARRMIFLLMSILVAAVIWAGLTPVDEITTGTGVIKTQVLVERLEHPDGGLVAEIHVSRGDEVTVGTPILTFDTRSLERELGKLTAKKSALQAEQSRITFLLEDKGTIPNFETIADLAPDELLFWVEQSYLAAQLDLLEAEQQSIEASIASIMARRRNLAQEAGLLVARLERSQKAGQMGIISRNDLEQQERELLQLERVLLEMDGNIAAQKNELETSALRKTELLSKRRREAALRRAEIEEKFVETTLSIAEISSRIERAHVVASVTGTVMELAVANPREVIAPGDLIAEIVPGASAVEAEIEVTADRIGNIRLGMEARLKVLSYDFTRFGEVIGRVAAISPSSFETETGETVFRVKIALPNNGESANLLGRPILPGMTVSADVLTDSKKVLTYLLKPLRVLSDRAFSEA